MASLIFFAIFVLVGWHAVEHIRWTLYIRK
jgi:hypothetical protein